MIYTSPTFDGYNRKLRFIFTAMTLIYLASPYTHANPAIKEQRFKQVCAVAGRLMKEGKNVFSPIAHSHPIEQYFEDGKPEGHAFWLKQDFAILAKSTKLVVLTLEGWETSTGVAAELQFAQANGIPFEFMDP